MNKNQGATIGAILLAGLLLRPIGSNTVSPGPEMKGGMTSAVAPVTSDTSSEGPWIASCNYWSPVRVDPVAQQAEPARPASESKGSISKRAGLEPGTEFIVQQLQVAPKTYDVHMENRQPGEGACSTQGLARWGLPSPPAQVRLRTMIATVPDPVHSHDALRFDRTIDALYQAAEDNQYTSSYYWLPWRAHGKNATESAGTGDKEAGHNPEREREPGLIVFKHVPNGDGAKDYLPNSTYYTVIYLFLVSETATEGVNGDQLTKALSYQEELRSVLNVDEDSIAGCASTQVDGQAGCNSRKGFGKTTIIGPAYTGSAASLKAAIDAHVSSYDTGLAAKRMHLSGRSPSSSQSIGLAAEQILPEIEINGATSSATADGQLNTPTSGATLTYHTFSDDSAFDNDKFRSLLQNSEGQYDETRVFQLVEEDTARGQAAIPRTEDRQFTVIRYPRDISVLRNAQSDTGFGSSGTSTNTPSPYLQLSLRDTAAEDSVPHFSREDTPLSQEAELMTIARQLNRSRAQFVAITGSNILDELYLMQFLHRACPDVRLLFNFSDLLLVREVDDVPYIGSITIGAYPMIGTGRANQRAYSDSASIAYYNAANYSFWSSDHLPSSAASNEKMKATGQGEQNKPLLASYSDPLEEPQQDSPPLWETAIGSDGYYPLALLDECSSSSSDFLPGIDGNGHISKDPCIEPKAPEIKISQAQLYPSLFWNALCVGIALLCLCHAVVMLVAKYWSPFTRDLAMNDNVEPERRAMYVRIGTAMLCSMSFAIAFPDIPLQVYFLKLSWPDLLCVGFALGAGATAGVVMWFKTKHSLRRIARPLSGETNGQAEERRKKNLCFIFGSVAMFASVGIPLTWACLCLRGQQLAFVRPESPTYSGILFAYRCIHPESGVSPVVPILLLLFGWYLWALWQTWRLRFSMTSRPVMPKGTCVGSRLFVSDQDLDECNTAKTDCGRVRRSSCLYRYLTRTLITPQLLRVFWKTKSRGPEVTLGLVYVLGVLLVLLLPPMNSLESLVRTTKVLDIPRLYERLVSVLLFPLLVIAFAGWLRMILIWNSLRGSLLERLENYPVRFAFSQLRNTGWMTMIRQGGLQEWWRDMARSSESMRQMLNDNDLRIRIENNERTGIVIAAQNWEKMQRALRDFETYAAILRKESARKDHEIMHEIEESFGTFAQALLEGALIPYWKSRSLRFVDSEDTEALPVKAKRSEIHIQSSYEPLELHAGREALDPLCIRIAEEFLALRYVSLIRSVLVNMRSLMSFVTAAFVLSIIAWNSYPFEPRQLVDWVFTALLFILGIGIVRVLAQMYRDPILSRITDTKANELGFDFWARLVSLGVVPVLTWLAYTFPDVGSFLFKIFQPAISGSH